MILESLMDIMFKLQDILMPISLPKFPDSVLTALNNGMEYVEAGAGILANYTPLPYLLTLLGIIVTVEASIAIYNIVMWVLKKIPTFGIS